jgi:hypothetical protein
MQLVGYSSLNIIWMFKSRMRWAGNIERMREMRNAYEILVGKSEGKRQLGSSGRRWEDNIKMDLRKIMLESLDFIHLLQVRYP